MRGTLTPAPERGLSLVEVLVAILVLSIATLGLFEVFGQAGLSAAGNRDRILAGIVARNRADEIALGLADLPGRVAFAGRTWSIETTTRATAGGFAAVEIAVRPESGGAAARLVTYSAPEAAR